jgi:hypothetical protein
MHKLIVALRRPIVSFCQQRTNLRRKLKRDSSDEGRQLLCCVLVNNAVRPAWLQPALYWPLAAALPAQPAAVPVPALANSGKLKSRAFRAAHSCRASNRGQSKAHPLVPSTTHKFNTQIREDKGPSNEGRDLPWCVSANTLVRPVHLHAALYWPLAAALPAQPAAVLVPAVADSACFQRDLAHGAEWATTVSDHRISAKENRYGYSTVEC